MSACLCALTTQLHPYSFIAPPHPISALASFSAYRSRLIDLAKSQVWARFKLLQDFKALHHYLGRQSHPELNRCLLSPDSNDRREPERVRPLHPKWRVDALALMRMDEEEISAESDSFVVYLLLTYLSFTYSENIYIFISSSALLHATALPLSAPSFLIHHANPLARARTLRRFQFSHSHPLPLLLVTLACDDMQRPHPIDVLPSPALIRVALATFSIFHSYLSPAFPVYLHNARIRCLFRPSLYVTFPSSFSPFSLLILCRSPPSLRACPILPRSNALYPGPSLARSLLSRALRFLFGHSLPSYFVLSSFPYTSSPASKRRLTRSFQRPRCTSRLPMRTVSAIQKELELATSSLVSPSSSEAGYAA
ncbi:hypothetical protein DFH09DRAFT_1505440 [Mycena vulgaris]|nr:hypothetical protein DFH09DRAFT_1505440 [Mycena vulgaris]